MAVQVPFSLVFTKTDKKKKRTPGPPENIAAFKRQLLQAWEVPAPPPPQPPLPPLYHAQLLFRVIYCRQGTRWLRKGLRPGLPAAAP